MQVKNKLLEYNIYVKIVDKCGWDMLEEYLGDDFVDGLYGVIQFRKGELGVIKCR